MAAEQGRGPDVMTDTDDPEGNATPGDLRHLNNP